MIFTDTNAQVSTIVPFDWFKLQEGEYIQLEPNTDDIVCSQVFPGLWLAKSALL